MSKSILILAYLSLIFLSSCGENLENLIQEAGTSEESSDSTASSLPRYLAISLNRTTCGINSSSKLFCWGQNRDSDDNVNGLVGTNVDSSVTFNTMQAVDSSEDYSHIAIGETAHCGITSSGSIKCWGKFATGTPSSPGNKLVPTSVEDSSGHFYTTITAGSYHACAITTSNLLKCWGDSWGGKLARTSNTDAVEVSDTGTSYSFISAGRNHTCGITTEKKLRCFGYNSNGQIGLGSESATSESPTNIDTGTDYIFVSSSQNGSCAITSGNKLKCWGQNTDGRVGNGSDTGNVNSPTLIDSSESYKFVSTGYSHTCAITTSNKLKCWGRNSSGELGQGSTGADETSPIVVDVGSDYKEVSARAAGYTCAKRLNDDLYCWGGNSVGQLGLGNNHDQTSPQEVQASF